MILGLLAHCKGEERESFESRGGATPTARGRARFPMATDAGRGGSLLLTRGSSGSSSGSVTAAVEVEGTASALRRRRYGPLSSERPDAGERRSRSSEAGEGKWRPRSLCCNFISSTKTGEIIIIITV